MFQCAPNFSEGRRAEVVAALADAIAGVADVNLIDFSADPDHNRAVMTFVGAAHPVREAALASARVAVARIDLRGHSGAHPRAGAIDVLPVVALRGSSRAEAIALALDIAQDLARDLALPVYLYELSARPGRQSSLPDLRRGGFEALAGLPLVGDHAPDFGPDRAHPRAGIAIVGARNPLVAYNVNLDTPDVTIAQAIARVIRKERDRRAELIGVRALGFYLASQNRAQVSLNLTRPDRTPLPAVFAFVRAEAEKRGVGVVESEIIGAIPEMALAGQPPESILWRAFRPTQILPASLYNSDGDV